MSTGMTDSEAWRGTGAAGQIGTHSIDILGLDDISDESRDDDRTDAE
jgi:hypothetical protein